MAYQLPWGSNHPGLIVYLIDLSGSMQYKDKIKKVSKIIWNVMDTMVAPCQDMGKYKERFHVEVVGYNQYTTQIFSGGVNQVIERLDNTDDTQMFFDTEKEGKAQGLTHMAMAFDKASEIIKNWIKKQSAADKPIPAPIVLNITDGFPEETGLNEEEARAKALKAANELQSITVPDGHVLLFNIHIDGEMGKDPGLMFPTSRPQDNRRGFLYDSSPVMENIFVERAKRAGLNASQGSRLLVSNISDTSVLSKIVLFGSIVSMLPNAGPDIFEMPETPI